MDDEPAERAHWTQLRAEHLLESELWEMKRNALEAAPLYPQVLIRCGDLLSIVEELLRLRAEVQTVEASLRDIAREHGSSRPGRMAAETLEWLEKIRKERADDG